MELKQAQLKRTAKDNPTLPSKHDCYTNRHRQRVVQGDITARQRNTASLSEVSTSLGWLFYVGAFWQVRLFIRHRVCVREEETTIKSVCLTERNKGWEEEVRQRLLGTRERRQRGGDAKVPCCSPPD